MFERLSKDGRVFEGITREHLKQYAEAGLRTLVVAYRELDEEEFQSWEQEFLNAQASVTADRDALVDAAAQKIERDLILLGVTAVEDKLQKGVSFNLVLYIACNSDDLAISFFALHSIQMTCTLNVRESLSNSKLITAGP